MSSKMGQPGKSNAARARDAALVRIVHTRRWVIGGAAALTAGIAGLVSAVAPGHSLASKSRAASTASTSAVTRSGAGSSIPRMPAPAKPSDLGLQGPQRAPSPAPQQSQPQQPQPQQQSPPQSIPSQPPAQSSSGGGDGPVVSGGS
jgi:hypothetical protein